MPDPPDRQLPLPLALPAPPEAPVGADRRRPRGRRAPRQLWLFAPYLQPPLPLAEPSAAGRDDHSSRD